MTATSQKRCSTCGEIKPLDQFYRQASKKDGLQYRCMECTKAKKRELWVSKGKPQYGFRKQPRDQWPAQIREADRRRKETARRRAGARARSKIDQRELWGRNAVQAFDYWLRVKATDEQAAKYWLATGKPWRNRRLSDGEAYAMQYRLDLEFQVKERMRRQVRKAKKRDGIAEVIRGAIHRAGISRKVERELGYSIAELMEHIERQFVRGMSWERYRQGEIHIDHITPQAAFDLANDVEWRACWSLSNLRPMWARDNMEKGRRVEFLC